MNLTSSPQTANLKLHRFGVAIVLFLVPLLLLALPLPPTKGKPAAKKQDWVMGLSLVIAAASGVVYFVPTPLFRRRSVWPLILGGTALLVAADAVWNDAYLDYVTAHKEYRREVFRRAMHNSHAPIYGRFDNAIARWDEDRGGYSLATLPFVLLAGFVAVAWYAWARRRPPAKQWDAKSLTVLCGFQLALIVAFALCEPPARAGLAPRRLTLNISGYSEFKKDIAAFNGIADTLRNYVAKMPSLEWYGQHYPPGNLIVLTIEKQLGLPGLTKALVCLLTVFSVIPLYGLARELDLDNVATTAALLLFAASTGVLVYCTINTTSMILFPAGVCLWMLVRALGTGSVMAAALLGLAFAFYLLFSFSASILGVLMALTTALAWWRGAVTTRNIVRSGAIAVACLFAGLLLLYVTTRFNLIACFITAIRGHQAQQGNEGFDTLMRWWLRSTGNILAYLTSIVPMSILAIRTVWVGNGAKAQAAEMRRSLFIALVATVLLAGFSGLFYVETERIWIFLTPFFALSAGVELARRDEHEGSKAIALILLLVLLISCSQEFLFQHYR